MSRARALAIAIALTFGACARAAVAQQPRAERWVVGPMLSYGVAAVAQTRFLADGNGAAVTGQPTLSGEVGFGWAWSHRGAEDPAWQIGVQLRGAFPTVRITESPGVGRDRKAGRATMLDLVVSVDRRVGAYRLHVGGGPGLLDGPGDVAPFRFSGVAGLTTTGEVGVERLIASDYVWATATGQIIRIGGASDGSAFRGGSIARVLLGVRLAP